MSGTVAGGQKAAKTNKEVHGPDFYRKIGASGGRNGTGHAFAHGKLDPSATGVKGGKRSAEVRWPK